MLLFILLPVMVPAQSRKQKKAAAAQLKADQDVMAALRQHILQLTLSAGSSDTGTAAYLSSQFSNIGLKPVSKASFIQPFSFADGKEVGSSTTLKINGDELILHKHYFPFVFSANKLVSGMPAMALREKGVPWFADVSDWLDETGDITSDNLHKTIWEQARQVSTKGASALIVYNTSNTVSDLQFNGKLTLPPLDIPVVFVSKETREKYMHDPSDLLDIELNTSIDTKRISGYNVAGLIDNGAPATVVISANYPNYTEKNNAMAGYAVGAATLVELARKLSSSQAKNNNYLIVAIDGQQLGTFGLKQWMEVQHDPKAYNYAICLNAATSSIENKKVRINDYHSSVAWRTLLNDLDTDVEYDTTINENAAAAEFYNKAIPVLAISKNITENNTATDVAIIKAITKIIEGSNALGKLAYHKATPAVATPPAGGNVSYASLATSSPQPQWLPSRTEVSLGVIADRSANNAGLRINGVSPKKLAAKIGLQPGDVLKYLGDYKIKDMNSYLHALAHFKPGDKTVVGIKRGDDNKEIAVEF